MVGIVIPAKRSGYSTSAFDDERVSGSFRVFRGYMSDEPRTTRKARNTPKDIEQKELSGLCLPTVDFDFLCPETII